MATITNITQDDRDLYEEIIAHCETIMEVSDRMTSGNYMHHKNQQKFSAKVIKDCVKTLLEDIKNDISCQKES